mmetsp:Transcript_62533/g.104068  ORF Transcript_62533/g.104068 Transcript_62533/m.104068 type:complete len:270 (+) Transcript_62533:30-839(+)|eukprot:CAMPEP_0119302276 /NCGR_PEP_ID=MMETSP1333-20130426/3902_1 /TAXON_ID=418940 /ORGANISM="Scyphosphaera apsteinii, Strain RCC1455" /LENGTH=269 /DNA_ID=CAMNT_0007304585 /DNA_START=22 /DNA_END=831 /DNA_ORIENTATION=-
MKKRAAADAGAPKSSKKRFFQSQALVNGGDLTKGMRGVLLTCDTHLEKKAVRECVQMLERLDEDESTAASCAPATAYNTAGAVLASELAALQSGQAATGDFTKGKQRFSVVQTGCGGNVMIRFQHDQDEPLQIVDRAMEAARTTGTSGAPHVVRLLPVQATCAANRASIMQAVTPLIQTLKGCEKTFAVQWRRRCNTGLDKMEVIDAIAMAMRDIAPKAKVDLCKPQVAVLLEVVKTVCCVSVLPDWQHFKSYNLRAICEKPAAAPEAA